MGECKQFFIAHPGTTATDYSNLHRWIRRQLGKAVFCSNNKEHRSTNYDWANISGEYKHDLSDYKPLCRSCHIRQDFTDERRKKQAAIAKVLRSKTILQFSRNGALIKKWDSRVLAAAALGMYSSAISNVLAGRARTAAGFIWREE